MAREYELGPTTWHRGERWVTSHAEDALATLLKWEKVATPVRELQFAKELGRRWRFDFAWPERFLAVEVEGGSWIAGAHTRGAHFEADCEKYDTAVLIGWRVLRFTPNMIDNGTAIEFIKKALAQ